jgi:hypothetical protein
MCAPSQAGGGAGPLKLGGIMPLWARAKFKFNSWPSGCTGPRVPLPVAAPAQAGKGS